MKDLNLPTIARIRWIRQQIQIARGRVNARTLARDYEVNEKTIHRDIEFLRDVIGDQIEYDAFHYSLRYVHPPQPIF